MSMMMTQNVPVSSQQDPINQKVLELGEAAMRMIDVAEQNAKTRETLCVKKSPLQSLVL
jgi:hypothetical protein